MKAVHGQTAQTAVNAQMAGSVEQAMVGQVECTKSMRSRVPTVHVVHRVHTVCGDVGRQRVSGQRGVCTAGGEDRGDTVGGMLVRTQSAGSSVHAQSAVSVVHAQWAGSVA